MHAREASADRGTRTAGRRGTLGPARIEAIERPALEGTHRPAALRAAFTLSALIAVGMSAASVAGLTVDGLYTDGAWAREALRGGDLVTLVVAAPLLILSLVLAVRGSALGQAAVLGMLAYSLYNFAYYAFGATFNDAFLLHIGLLAMSIVAFASALAGIDAGAVARAFSDRRAPRAVGAFLVLVGVAQGLLWVVVVLRQAITGETLRDIPIDGQHLVFAIDLGLLVPALVVAGVLLWRRTPLGFLLGAAVTLMGAVYQLNLLAAGWFQDRAGVRGVAAFPIEGLVLTAGFVIAAGVMFAPGRGGREPR